MKNLMNLVPLEIVSKQELLNRTSDCELVTSIIENISMTSQGFYVYLKLNDNKYFKLPLENAFDVLSPIVYEANGDWQEIDLTSLIGLPVFFQIEESEETGEVEVYGLQFDCDEFDLMNNKK